jgi:ribonuclease HII
MVTIVGIDEAGRGPVIGPMVMCGILIDIKDEIKLKSIGAKDSKLLTPRTREMLYDQILRMVKKYEVVIIPASEIDDALLSPTLNLNWLEAIKTAEILDKLKPDEAILDCPSNNIKAYMAYVKKHMKHTAVNLKAEYKADLHYPVVSAASIIAKVTRDREIEKIKQKIGIDFGSGYTSDERTQKFLKENWNKYPEIFRKTWSTYKNIAQPKSQSKLGEF